MNCKQIKMVETKQFVFKLCSSTPKNSHVPFFLPLTPSPKVETFWPEQRTCSDSKTECRPGSESLSGKGKEQMDCPSIASFLGSLQIWKGKTRILRRV